MVKPLNATIRQIADLAKVSVGTVSHVLNGSAPVKDELRNRVLKAVETLEYVPSQLGRGLRRQQTNIIGMIIPDISNPFFPGVVRGAQDAAFDSDRLIILCNSDNSALKEARYLHEIRSYRPAGLIIIPASEDTFAPFSNTEIALPFPIVCIDRKPRAWRGDSVAVDNRHGGGLAAEHLLNLGHRHFGIISGPASLTLSSERIGGFCDRLSASGLGVALEDICEGQFDRASGYDHALALLDKPKRPTALFVCNDLMATGALAAMRDLGLNCPRDVALVGFDNLEMGEFTQPTLTSVNQNGYDLGRAATELLLRRIMGGRIMGAGIIGDGAEPEHIVLPVSLEIRQSSGASQAN